MSSVTGEVQHGGDFTGGTSDLELGCGWEIKEGGTLEPKLEKELAAGRQGDRKDSRPRESHMEQE